MHDDEDNDDQGIEDMDWEPTPDTTTGTIQQVRRVHFSFNLVAATHIVPRDCLSEIARGKYFSTRSECEWPRRKKVFVPARLFLQTRPQALRQPSLPEPEEPVVFIHDDGSDDLDWEPTPVVVEYAVTTTEIEVEVEVEINTESESESESESKSEACMLDDAMILDDDVEMELPVVLVPALRRSKRLAERRLHHELASTCNQVVVPEVLGSIFVNGRRRSARHLKVVAGCLI